MAEDYGNWLGAANKFSLSEPPEWWLKRLYDQDSALVVFPSQTRPNTYVLARRRSASKELHRMFKGHVQRPRISPDSDILAANNLIYVAHLLGTQFSETVFAQLKESDMWARGGADKVIEEVESKEAAAADRSFRSWLDDIDHRARDAWRSYKARTGQRNQRSTSATKVKIVQAGSL